MGIVLGLLLFYIESKEQEREVAPNQNIEIVEAQELNRDDPIIIEESSDIETSDDEFSSSSSSSEDGPGRNAYMPRRVARVNPFNRRPNNNIF